MYKPNYFQRRTKFQGPRTNHRIKSIDVQVINSNGENLGILPLKKAIDTAKQEGLDLIEISPNAKPPVCKIMDMGKYKYDMQKKANKAKKNQKIGNMKSGGFSSKFTFFDHLIEETKIRLHNSQNVFFVFLIFINAIFKNIFKK